MIVSPSFDLDFREKRRALHVRIAGQLDGPILVSDELITALARRSGGLMVLYLAKVQTVNTEGLEALERLVAKADAARVKLRIVAPYGTRVRRALDLLHFPNFVVVRENLVRALRFGR